MSIVAVHGPNMSGGTGAGGGGTGVVITAPQVKATADMTNGQKFTFEATDKTRAPGDYDWAFPGGTPATAVDNKGPITVTYSTAGSKVATLTIAAGAGPPPGGAYPITVEAMATSAPRSLLEEGDEESTPEDLVLGFDPSEHTVADVEAYVTEHPDEAEEILSLEENGKNRVTLVSFLENLILGDE